MENAVKALIIAAGVLIGLMILSLGISLYSSLNEFVEEFEKDIADQKIQQFNEQFTRYINCDDSGNINFKLTIQDVVTAANIAYENNQNNGDYITIKLKGVALEDDINSDSATILKEGLEKEYKCSPQDVKINTTTGKVDEVNFHKYEGP